MSKRCVICDKKIPRNEDNGTFFAKNGDIGFVCMECVEKFKNLQRVEDEDDCKAKPCPYCDSRKIEAVQLLRNYNYCNCFDCGARTPYYATVEEAIDAWNRGEITKQ